MLWAFYDSPLVFALHCEIASSCPKNLIDNVRFNNNLQRIEAREIMASVLDIIKICCKNFRTR
jgi:hypothetical protein